MQLDDVALGALLPETPASRPLDSDVVLAVVFEDDELSDATATRHFERFSSPYERIELSEVAPLPRRARRTTFAKTVAFGRGTPIGGVPSVDARATVKMAAVRADTVEMPAAGETVEMPAAGAVKMRAAVNTVSRSAAVTAASKSAAVELPAFAPPSATVPFERVWFDDEPAASQELLAQSKTSWWWLAISLVAGAAAVVWMASLA